MNSCESITEAKSRINDRNDQIVDGLETSCHSAELPSDFYIPLLDAESERYFIHIISRKIDRLGRVTFTNQSAPSVARAEYTIKDAVMAVTGLFKHRDMVLLTDGISAAELITGSLEEFVNGSYQDTPYGVVRLFIENNIALQPTLISSQAHSQTPIDVLR